MVRIPDQFADVEAVADDAAFVTPADEGLMVPVLPPVRRRDALAGQCLGN